MFRIHKLLITIAYGSMIHLSNASLRIPPTDVLRPTRSALMEVTSLRKATNYSRIKLTLAKHLSNKKETPFYTPHNQSTAPWEMFLDMMHPPGVDDSSQKSWGEGAQLEFMLHKNVIPPAKARKDNARNIADLEYTPDSEDIVNVERLLKLYNSHARSFNLAKSELNSFEYDLLGRKIRRLIEEAKDRGVEVSEPLPTIQFKDSNDIVDAYSVNELAGFFLKIQKHLGQNDQRSFLFSPIVVGVPITLKYADGVVSEAKAEFGSDNRLDILTLIRSMPSIPKTITDQNKITVNGYFYINTQDFNLLNLVRRNAGQRAWKDSRRAIANALLYSEEPNKALELRLKSIFVDYSIEDRKTRKQLLPSTKLKHLEYLGFHAMPRQYTKVGTWQEATYICQGLAQLPFESSGFLIQLNSSEERSISDIKECKYKFVPTLKTTTVEDIVFRVLPKGTVVADIYVSPININGKSYSRFTVNNRTHWDELDLRLRDTILIGGFPNMLPQIFKSYQDSSDEFTPFPNNCPKCLANLTAMNSVDGEEVSFCSTHLSCISDSTDAIIHFVSACGLNIPSLSSGVITELVNKQLISNIEDVFLLTSSDYQFLDNMSQKAFDRLLLEINLAKTTTLPRFIYALNIPSITYIMAEQLALKAGTIDRLKAMTRDEIAECDYLCPTAVESVGAYFSDSNNLKKSQRLLESGVVISEPTNEVMELCYSPIKDYILEKYENLIKKIQANNKRFSLTDFEFDLLNHTADKIEKLHPDWIIPRMPVPLQKKLVSWEDPIFLKKTYSITELKHMLESASLGDIVIEPKVNGIACALIYDKGVLIQALTKHDGFNGYDISEILIKGSHIPQKLSREFTGMIRGELYLLEEDFRRINNDRQLSGLDVYVDAFATLNNLIKRNEKKLHEISALRFFGYKVIFKNNSTTGNSSQLILRSDMHNYLKDMGFRTVFASNYKVFYDTAAAIQYATDIESRRIEFPVSIDGMVLKPLELLRDIGELAYKFDQEIRTSMIKNINYSILRDGLLAAVAEINPIKFSNGRVVSHVQIQNMDVLSDLCKNDYVIVKYSGGIRPILEEINKDKRQKNASLIIIPTLCPECQQRLHQQKAGVLRCTNTKCIGPKSPKAIGRFAKIMGISNFSNLHGSVAELLKENIITRKADFYRLIPEDIHGKTKLTISAIQSLFTNIERSKNYSFDKLLLALGIPKLGPQYVRLVAKAAPNLKILSQYTEDDLYGKGINRSVAKAIVEYFEKNKDEIEYLSKIFIIKESKPRDNNLMRSMIKHTSFQERFRARQSSVDELVWSLQEKLKMIIIANDQDLIRLGINHSTSPRNEEVGKVEHLMRSTQTNNRRFLSMLERYSATSLKQTGYSQSPQLLKQNKSFFDTNEEKIDPEENDSLGSITI